MTRKLTYFVASTLLFLHGCSLFLDPQQVPVQLTPTKGLDTSIELTAVDVNHLGFKIYIDGWREDLTVQNLWLQDANGNVIELESMFSTINMEGSSFIAQYDLMPARLLPPGRFIGQIILSVGERPSAAPLHVLKFDLDVKLNPSLHVDIHQAAESNGVRVLLESAEISPSSTTLLVCYDKPTVDDWLPGNSTMIHSGKTTALNEEFILLFDAQSGYTGRSDDSSWVSPLTSGRCGIMRFPIGWDAPSGTVTLTIDELELSSAFTPPGVDFARAQEELLKQGIEIEIVKISEVDGAGNSWNILKKPDEMDYADVIRMIRKAMGFYLSGPWSFSIPIAR